ncbi:MAG: glycosyltransferase family 2 protein, partial [Melioribacteraceae bacterium]|nr:glycosyltransferase family 2 protein [Melioribacteraceae bacterium]
IGHLCCVRKSIAITLGGFRAECNGSQDHDFWLRASLQLKSDQIIHIPKILYHWRLHNESTSKEYESKPYAWDAGVFSVQSYVDKKYPEINLNVEKGDYPFTYKLRFKYSAEPKVSIIIPTRDRVDLLKTCVDGILERTNWNNLEIIIVDNGSVQFESKSYFEQVVVNDSRVKVVREDIEFNWSKLNNIGASISKGEFFIFLNNDTDVIEPNWVSYLIGYASMPDVGVVGSLLLFEDGTIQHSGVIVGMGGWADHVYRTSEPNHYISTPYISPVITRNVLAVTGACLAISANKFNELGKFDESFIICGSDVELGVRAHKKGYFNVLCAESLLYHYESKTRSSFIPENDFYQSEIKYEPYRKQLVDPFYNENLNLSSTFPKLGGS